MYMYIWSAVRMCPRVCTPCIFPSNYMEWYFPPLIKTFTKVWEAAYCTTHTAETTSGEIQTIFDLKWIEAPITLYGVSPSRAQRLIGHWW